MNLSSKLNEKQREYLFSLISMYQVCISFIKWA